MTLIQRDRARSLALALFLPVLLAFPPAANSQPADRPCVVESAPADDFQSRGLGLTVEELGTLYGPSEVGQGSIFFDEEVFQLHKVDCDLVLVFPQDGSGGEVDETALAESLLPAYAELVGTVALGTTIAEYEGNTLWRSAALAERFAAMGENRSGDILIVYTYAPMDSAIERVELRTLALPE